MLLDRVFGDVRSGRARERRFILSEKLLVVNSKSRRRRYLACIILKMPGKERDGEKKGGHE
jgi:hypothetical protein